MVVTVQSVTVLASAEGRGRRSAAAAAAGVRDGAAAVTKASAQAPMARRRSRGTVCWPGARRPGRNVDMMLPEGEVGRRVRAHRAARRVVVRLPGMRDPQVDRWLRAWATTPAAGAPPTWSPSGPPGFARELDRDVDLE